MRATDGGTMTRPPHDIEGDAPPTLGDTTVSGASALASPGEGELVLALVWAGDAGAVRLMGAPPADGRPLPIGRAHFLGGRSLREGDPRLSRHHFDVRRSGAGALTVRNRSRWGLRLNGEALDGDASRSVCAGDVVRAGRSLFVVHPRPAEEPDDALSTSIVGGGPAIAALRNRIRTYASSPHAALVLGETGVGKERVARALHDLSDRARHRYVALNCASVSANLAESELFGHERGAFSGADRRKEGLLEVADGGTLFLDELGELPPEIQPKLLRVLQDGTFLRVGGTATLHTDARVVAATNRELREMTAAGTFREDLLERLCVLPIAVPPLRDRREDVPALAMHFVARHGEAAAGRLSTDDVERLVLAAWPRNVRELENVVIRALVSSRGGPLKLVDEDRVALDAARLGGPTPPPMGTPPPAAAAPAAPPLVRRPGTFDDWRALARHLAEHGWHATEAMAAVGRPRNYLYRQLARFGIADVDELAARYEAEALER